MTDIVERLRLIDPTLELRYAEDVTRLHEIGLWCVEAADEIEHLRELNGAWKLTVNDLCEIIERLRAALRGIACTDDTCECGYVEGEGPFCELGRARAALGEKE